MLLLTGYPVLPDQGLQCDIVTPSQGCHHLDIAGCSLVSVGIKLLCPWCLPLSSSMLFLWSTKGCYGAGFLGSRRLPDCPGPLPAPSDSQWCRGLFWESLCWRVHPGGTSRQGCCFVSLLLSSPRGLAPLFPPAACLWSIMSHPCPLLDLLLYNDIQTSTATLPW